jgi:hypothetical protein
LCFGIRYCVLDLPSNTIEQYTNKGWYNPIGAPSFSVEDGAIVKEGTLIVITCTNPQYKVAYTTNDEGMC